MKLFPSDKLGIHESLPGVVDFGLFLPWVLASVGNRQSVKVIHEKDQFPQDIGSVMFELSQSIDEDYRDDWST